MRSILSPRPQHRLDLKRIHPRQRQREHVLQPLQRRYLVRPRPPFVIKVRRRQRVIRARYLREHHLRLFHVIRILIRVPTQAQRAIFRPDDFGRVPIFLSRPITASRARVRDRRSELEHFERFFARHRVAHRPRARARVGVRGDALVRERFFSLFKFNVMNVDERSRAPATLDRATRARALRW